MDTTVDWKAPKVGIGVVVYNEADNTFLAGMRTGSHGAGEWGLPGGGMDPGETPQETAIREVREETGLIVADAQQLPFTSFDTFPETGAAYVTLYYLAQYTGGEAQRLEPHKCLEWRWFSWEPSSIPSPMFCRVTELVSLFPSLSSMT